MSENQKAPVQMLERDINGLLKNQDYIYNEFGRVDWKSLIPKKFLAPNKLKTQETDVSKLEDKDLIVLLGGYRHLAEIRGYTDAQTKVTFAGPEYVCANCIINFIPNYETEGKSRIYAESADAHPGNTSGFGKIFLATVACNRAFARTVRNFLNINIVAEEEISDALSQQAEAKQHNSDPVYSKLEELLTEKNLTFEFLKEQLIDEKFVGIETILQLSDIPKFKAKEFLKKLKKFKKL